MVIIMKKLVSMVLVGALAFSFTACGEKGVVVKNAEDLMGAKIGVQLGTTGDIYCSGDFGDENVEKYNKGVDAVQALIQNKIDAVVIDDLVAEALVEKQKGLKILDTPYKVEEYALAIKKGNTELTDDINAAIDTLRENGTFDSIVDFYLNDESTEERYVPVNENVNGTLIMGTNAEFPPYEFKENGEIVGIDADFAYAIADVLGMELKIEDMLFDSLIAAVDSEKIDFAAAGMTVTEERLKSVNFSQSYLTGKQAIIVKE